MRLLIAEDDKTMRRFLRKNLEEHGYEIIECDNGRDAYTLIKNQGIRLALVDWMLPEMDGLSLCEKIREKNLSRYVYLIILTAKSEKADLITALKAGVDDFLTKPFDGEELILRLNVGDRILKLEEKQFELQKKLMVLAKEDPLTNIYNRRALLDEALGELNRASRDRFSLSMILSTIDNFKTINEAHGHKAGDEVLIQFAQHLKNVIRPYDTVGRYSNNAFGILLPNTDDKKALLVARRLLKSFKDWSCVVNKQEIAVTVSMGIATYQAGAESHKRYENDRVLEELVSITEKALHDSKNMGGGQIVVAGP